jgi:glycosyltransferase involved in cell wall biosynthesis
VLSNVLHVIPAIAARYGGPSTVTLGLCRALDAKGISSVVATTDADGSGRLPVATGTMQLYGGVPVIFFRRHVNEAIKYAAGMQVWLRDHVHEFDIVHIHAVLSHACLVAGRVCQAAEVPYIVRPLGTLDPWSLGRKRHRKKALLWLGGQKLLSGAAAIHYTTAEEMRLAESTLTLPKGIVVPLGVDDSLFADEPSRQRQPYVLSMGRLDAKKGVDLLIQAFHAVHAKSSSRWRLVIAGDGDPQYVAVLRRLAMSGPANGFISFTGWVSGDIKTRLLRCAGLFALPSHQENFGLAVAEAMACGVPVLVSEGVNLAQEIAAADAGWVVSRDPDVFTHCLSCVLDDHSERERRGRQGRGLAEQYRWPAVADRIVTLYQDVITSASRAAVRSGDAAVDRLGSRTT